ncbi:MAG: ATP-binding protein [Gemmatimonadetes bacterium]|nr:ATP-binding protein [Gemmatimonadota bacterium]
MNEADIARLAIEGRETRSVELKASMPWADLGTKAKVLKAVAALANTADGGLLLFGLTESDPPGTHALTGVPEAVSAGFATDDVASFVNSHVYPSVSLDVRHVVVEGLQVVGIAVRQFTDIPVMITKALDIPGEKGSAVKLGAIYVRGLKLNATCELSAPDDLRELVRLASLRELERYFQVRALERDAGPGDTAKFLAQLKGWES